MQLGAATSTSAPAGILMLPALCRYSACESEAVVLRYLVTLKFARSSGMTEC